MSASGKSATRQPGRADGTHIPSDQTASEVIRISSPACLLAAVPVLLKFEPTEPSIVVLGTVPPRSTVALTLRYDINGPHCAEMIGKHSADILAAQGIKTVHAVGYGPGDLVTPVADALRAQFTEAGITVRDLLRVQESRYWSYICTDPGCCPPEGKAFNLKAHPITRKFANRVLSSRDALAGTVAPVTGDAADSMRQATRAAEKRAARVVRRANRSRNRVTRRRALLQTGLEAVADALSLYRAGGTFESHEDAAWLALVLEDLRIRDDAWARMDPKHCGVHRRLWTDLTTLAQPGYAAAPASLLAFTAWQDGDGALGNVALDRALADDPHYSMALLLRQALDAGAPPSMARLPMTPEDVAAAYDDAEESEQTVTRTDPGRAPAPAPA